MALNEEIGKTKEYIKIGSDFKAGDTFNRNDGNINRVTGAEQTTVDQRKGNLLKGTELYNNKNSTSIPVASAGSPDPDPQKRGYLVANHIIITNLDNWNANSHGFILSNEGPEKPGFRATSSPSGDWASSYEGEKINSFTLFQPRTGRDNDYGYTLSNYTWRTTGKEFDQYSFTNFKSQNRYPIICARMWVNWSCPYGGSGHEYRNQKNYLYSYLLDYNDTWSNLSLAPKYCQYAKRTIVTNNIQANYVYQIGYKKSDLQGHFSQASSQNHFVNLMNIYGKVLDNASAGTATSNLGKNNARCFLKFGTSITDSTFTFIQETPEWSSGELTIKNFSISNSGCALIDNSNFFWYPNQTVNGELSYNNDSGVSIKVNNTPAFCWIAGNKESGYCEFKTSPLPQIFFHRYDATNTTSTDDNGTTIGMTYGLTPGWNTDFYTAISSGGFCSCVAYSMDNNDLLLYVLVNNGKLLNSSSSQLFRITLKA